MKILNLYCGIGGNRKLWGDEHEIVAIENEMDIALAYRNLFPNDTVKICDAHEYLLNHFKEFDFIWSSPPCQSHSQFRQNINVNIGQSEPLFPDMKLYQEIIFLKHNFKGKWIVENVKPYYEPLIKPSFEMERHLWWNNFHVDILNYGRNEINLIKRGQIKDLEKKHGFDLSKIKLSNKRQILRNCVSPQVGLHILQSVTAAGCYANEVNFNSH